MKNQLVILGAGTRRLSQLTLEGLRALKEVRHILYLEIGDEEAASFFKEHGLHSFSGLNLSYRPGDIDTDNYARIRNQVEEALRIYKKVALVVSGHPRLGVYLTGVLEKSTDYDTQVLEGISSFASMVNMLKRDPLEKGTQIVDANRLLLFDYELEPRMDAFIYHVCSTANPRTDFTDPGTHNRLDLLLEALLSRFPADHPVAFVSAAIDGGEGSLNWFPLSELAGKAASALFSVTLFVPGVKPKKINRPVYEIMQSRIRSAQ